ncbi:phage tail tape measure protein [Clostridiaceae bacterium 14S0207]|nr:phage tail tape measure protein [Clostridiaceae bacterium 14S0207]
MKALNKVKASPSVRLKDKLSKPVDKIKSKMSKLNKVKANPSAKLKDKATKPAEKIEKKTKKVDKIRAKPTVKLKDEATKPLNRIKAKLSTFSKSVCSKLAAIATAGVLMVGGLGVNAALRDFSNFEQGLANVKAISGATAQEMQVLSKEAKRLGATTAWSAKDVTDAETLLSQAGFSVKETVSALPGLLDLASAGELDLAQATDITAGTLRAFGIEASKSAHVADVLALTASRTNSDVSGLGESMKYVAPISKSLGISMEETSAAIGLLANNNIKGSQAGTVLRASLARLANPSKEASKVMKKLGFTAFDAKGKMLPLSKVIGNLQHGTRKLSRQQKAQAISTIFGTEAMSGMMALVEQGPEKLSKLTKELEGSDGAAKNMANTRLDSLQGQMTILKSAVEGMNIELGEKLAPYAKEFVTWFTGKIPDITKGVVKVVDSVSKLIKKFNNLTPAANKILTTVAIGIVAFNPLTKVIKGTSTALTFLIGLSPKLSAFFGITKKAKVAADVTKTVVTGAGAATKGVEGLSLATKASTILLNPWVLGIAAAGFGIYKLHKHLSSKCIPAVKEFGEGISKSTADAMNSYMALDKKVGQSLMDIKINSKKITVDIAKNMTSEFNDMGVKVKDTIDKKYNEIYTNMEGFMTKANCFTDKQNAEILKRIKDKQDFEKQLIDDGQKRINEIYQKAASEHRKTTAEEEFQINTIRENSLQSMIENISKSSAEQLMIQGKLKNETSILTAQQAADIVKESAKARDGAIKSATEEADKVIENARMQRDVLGILKPEEAKTIIEAAEHQKEVAIANAEGMHEEVVMHAREQASEHVNQVNWQTGEVLSNFDSMIAKIKEFNALSIKEKVIRVVKTFIESGQKRDAKRDDFIKKQKERFSRPGKGYATGTEHARSGMHEVAEHGFEIILDRQYRKFNGGEKVLNNKKSKKFLGSMINNNNETQEKPKLQFAISKPQLAGAGANNVNVDMNVENNFNNDTDIDQVVEEAAKQFAFKLKQALKNIKG